MERQHVLTEVFNLEDPVVLHDQDRTLVGEVVGVRMSGPDALYDVSCETSTIKAVFEDELELATGAVLHTELNAILNAAVAGSTAMAGREGRRRAVLRNEHVMFLRKAMACLQEPTAEAAHLSTSCSVGDRLALRSDGAFDLCVVSGMRRQHGNVLVQVDCMGDVRFATAENLLQLSDVPSPGHGLALGERARFVVAGKEDDGSYEGVICKVEREGDDWRFSLVFDDGDVFEDLDTNDLLPCASSLAFS